MIAMPVRYALFENNFTSEPDDHTAIVQVVDGADLEAVVRTRAIGIHDDAGRCPGRARRRHRGDRIDTARWYA